MYLNPAGAPSKKKGAETRISNGMKIVLNEPKRNIIVNFAPQIEGQKARKVTIQVQVILCQINIFCQQLTENMKTFLSDLQRYTKVWIL